MNMAIVLQMEVWEEVVGDLQPVRNLLYPKKHLRKNTIAYRKTRAARTRTDIELLLNLLLLNPTQ